MVHVVREGETTQDMYYGTMFCGDAYRSSFKPTLTKKRAVTCLLCLARSATPAVRR